MAAINDIMLKTKYIDLHTAVWGVAPDSLRNVAEDLEELENFVLEYDLIQAMMYDEYHEG